MVPVFLLKLFYPISINPATSLIKGKLHPLQSCCMFENDKPCVLGNLYLLEITILDVWKKMLRHTGASTAACTHVSKVSAQRFSIVIMHTKYEKIRTMFVCARKNNAPFADPQCPFQKKLLSLKECYLLKRNALLFKECGTLWMKVFVEQGYSCQLCTSSRETGIFS